MKNQKKIIQCDICEKKKLQKIFDLKSFPLTGIYLKKKNKLDYFDNTFSICKNCGHGQLINQIDPVLLYKKTYSHRTSQSPLAVQINKDFLDKLKKIIKDKKFKCILEVGCNDLYLTNKLKKYSNKIIGTDPIWKNNITKVNKKISVVGGFINEKETLENIKELGGDKIDLVISSHTFEHVDKVKESLKKISNIVSDNCIFVIETPSLDSIIRNGHFDQIFHQHLHYFSESSIKKLTEEINCSLINIFYNYQIWGGNVMYHFSKNRNKLKIKIRSKNYFKINEIKHKYEKFQNHCKNKIKFLKEQKNKIIGFGAAQMMPILSYHSKSDFNFLHKLYDDNIYRQNKYLALINKKITKTNVKEIKKSFVLITANEMCRPIIKRLLPLNPKRIITWHSDI
jgi:2-polyprenyl-3-methyl-5-hydroxy-6-metoxy-1,4-benzoquinol methylase